MKRMYLLNTSLLASVALAANKGTGSAAMKAEPAFTFEDVPLPVSARGGFGARGEPTELAKKLAAVPLDKSFLEAVTISDSISDPAERKKIYENVAKKYLAEGSIKYLYHRRVLVALTDKVEGYKQLPDGLIRVVGVKLK